MDASCSQGQPPAHLDSGGIGPLSHSSAEGQGCMGPGKKVVYDQIGEEVNSWTKKTHA